MSENTINLATLPPAVLADLFAQMRAAEQAEKDARKAEREEQKEFLARFVGIVREKFATRTFKSGAVGVSLGGTVNVDGTDYVVSVLIRDKATIPAREASTDADA